METDIKQTYSSLKCMFIPMYVLPYLPHYITTPMTLVHGHVNACSWYQSKEKKGKKKAYYIKTNPNIAC